MDKTTIDFGNYLLSDERQKLILSNNNWSYLVNNEISSLHRVTHADCENYLEKLLENER